jgi:hypothetical protein
METSILSIKRLHGLQTLDVDAVIPILDSLVSTNKRGLAQELVGFRFL